ncbi:galactomannan galactosyltransferase 1-like [Cynara cardunculus var. scolymus]|uniref:Galactosyl transferase n=1 Tax=Cynara cardunculus var. scolymus TaxID=59895 RepID=A0A103XSD6_CYNCS|nr:galactomannan galactosyltransferase 1-like [Cynara cardunculus var. scolymus]KVH96013.1 Galactosyl transferase [Cynara cardunculus var. scolymus]
MVAFHHLGWRKPAIRILDRPSVFLAGAVSALLLLWGCFFFSTLDSIPFFSRSKSGLCNCNQPNPAFNLQFDPPVSTFYDDPSFGYTVDKRITNWDQKRRTWLGLHPSFEPRSHERVFIVTGSRSTPCKSPTGDHFLLRFYRNKVDYCRIHGYDIFYNNVLLDPKMPSCWAKIPAVRAAMLAHPEAEWIWWLDEDAAFTDMEYKLPLQRYKDYNFIVHGWPKEVYVKKSWLGLNAGSFLIRNCQWSLDLLDSWADMGPRSPNFDKWAGILMNEFKHESDDQTALAYLLLKEHQQWGTKRMHIETGYYLEGYWVLIVDTLKNITERYLEIETTTGMLRRRHAEKVSERYGVLREPSLKDAGNEFGSWRRPFVTHFAGCQPCNGKHNPLFTGKRCRDAMNIALNFADNQVLRNYGFVHRNLSDSSVVSPLPFDYPA